MLEFRSVSALIPGALALLWAVDALAAPETASDAAPYVSEVSVATDGDLAPDAEIVRGGRPLSVDEAVALDPSVRQQLVQAIDLQSLLAEPSVRQQHCLLACYQSAKAAIAMGKAASSSCSRIANYTPQARSSSSRQHASEDQRKQTRRQTDRSRTRQRKETKGQTDCSSC